jgi:hypothetical protein
VATVIDKAKACLVGSITVGIVGYAYATPCEIMMSTTIVDISGHQKTEIHTGEPVGFSSFIENHSAEEKRLMHVVRVLDV